MIFGVLPNVFVFWWIHLLRKGLLLHLMRIRDGMISLKICLRIYCSILNFRLCTIWLPPIFLIARIWIGNLRMVIFLIRKQPWISFLSIHPTCDWGKIIWSNFILPTKTLVFWKLLHKSLPTYLYSYKRVVFLCRLQVEDIDYLFSNCSVVSSIWTWLKNIFPDRMDLSSTSFITFIKLLVILLFVKLQIITLSLWMT